MSTTVYINFGVGNTAPAGRVSIGDIGSVLCEDKAVQAKVRALTLMEMPEKKGYREVFSVMSVIEQIQKKCPGVEVNNIGEADFVIKYDDSVNKNKIGYKAVSVVKAALIGIVIFLGSAFAIMTYNNDVGIPELFEKIYEFVLGSSDSANGALELSYSAGLLIGIVIFYNHFGGAKFDKDPTPIEVQMRNYEKDLDNAVVEDAGRSGKERDVT